jgi:hypothetical protein
MSATMSSPSDDSKLVNYLVRMVVPLRREFGQNLDVQHFLHDLNYAQAVLKTALSSQDPRLREQAEYVSKLKFGPRVGQAAPAVTAPAATAAAPGPAASIPAGMVERRKIRRDVPNSQFADTKPAATPDTPLSAEEEMKARIMKKYTSGLR